MELKIISDKKNPLLSRREVSFRVEHKGKPTPTKDSVSGLLAAKLDVNLDLMVIEDFHTGFGQNISNGLCLVYESQAAMNSAEPKRLLNAKKRIGKKEEKTDEAQGNKEK